MSRPGFNFLVCPDPELIRQQIDALVEEHGGGLRWDRRAYWADEELPGSFWSDLTIPDLMGTPRLVVVRRAHKFLKEQWDKLVAPLGSKTDSIWPIFCLENAPDKKGNPKPPAIVVKQKFWPVADKFGWVWMSPGLTARSMPDFVRGFAGRKRLSIAPDVERALCEALPHDAIGARNELDKIVLAAGDTGEVKKEHLEVISHQSDMDTFAFIAAVIEGTSGGQVWKKVFDDRRVPASKSILFSFLALLQREARLLWELACGDTPSAWVPAFVQKQKATLAKRIGPTRIASIWELALEAEFGIKTGQRTPEQAFEALVSGLHTSLGAKTPPKRR